MNWSIVGTIIIDATKVSASQTNFPVLFSGAYQELRTVAYGGSVQHPAGFDIIFAADSAGASPLPFERAAWLDKTGAIEAWIQLPTLSSTTNTTIYILIGNAAITTDQQTPTSVWDSNFKGVWHLRNVSGVTGTDSTGINSGIAGNNGQPLPAIDTGRFGAGGASFNGSQGIYLPSMSLSSFTLSCWIKPTGSSTGAMLGGFVGAVEFRYIGGSLYLDLVKQQQVDMGNSSPNAATLNVWQHVALIYNQSSGIGNYYINGAAAGGLNNAQTFNAGNYYIGSIFEGFQGSIDELHYSNSLRSQSWLQTEYNNQNSPTTFYSTTLTPNPVSPIWGPFPASPALFVVGAGAAAGSKHQITKTPAFLAEGCGGSPVIGGSSNSGFVA